MDREIIVVSLLACQRMLPPASPYQSRIAAELERLRSELFAEGMRPYAPAKGANIGTTIDISA